KDELLHGDCKWYYENGIPQMTAYYENNQLNGKMTRWHENGQLQSEAFYKDNSLDSVFLIYSIEGKKVISEYYQNDTLHGPYYRWYENGKTMIEGAYSNGMMDGTWFYFHADGNMAAKADFEMGTGIQKAYHENGVVSMITRYKDNKKHGKEEFFNYEGKLSLIRVYEAGELTEEIPQDY
ncbi:MAG TPA: toxin-antitoxin system YwqK family antitoxin, partial [Bacteroidales bacterium]|nr:toxin-antitoxin system YwqK family antitoxin [Bacteroidales bacterium]